MVEEQQVDLEGCLDSAGGSPGDLCVLPGAYCSRSTDQGLSVS